MADSLTPALAYARDHHARFIEELKSFVSIPSISTDPQAAPDIQRAAQWVASRPPGLYDMMDVLGLGRG